MGGLIVVEDSNNHRVSLTPKDGATGDRTVTIPDYPLDKETDTTGFKNLLINGGFNVWQRGISQTSSGYGSDDRWSNGNVGTTKVHSRQVATDTERALFNSNFFSRTVVTSVAGTSNFCLKKQLIEDVTKLAGKTVTFSFWAKADTPKNIAIEVFQNFGTGGTPSSIVDGIESQLIALTTTWTKYSITLTVPSIIGKTLGTDGTHTSFTAFYFWFDAGSTFDARTASLGQQSGTFDIAEAQIEEGSVATPFEQRPIGLELALCQRYFWKYAQSSIYMHPIYNSTTNLGRRCSVYFPQEMRVNPTVTNITAGGLSDTPTLGATRTRIAIILGTASTATSYTNLLTANFDAEL